ncbi:MAG: ATPase, T2SS/T4P/T4SS family [Candidatus Omnitrophota bacterium]
MFKKETDNHKSWDDRRRHYRVASELTMEYRAVQEDGSDTEWNKSLTKNISAAGIYFETYYPLGLNTILEVKLNASSFPSPVLLKARIVRAEEIQVGEIYGVAAAITQIADNQRVLLQHAIEQIDISSLLKEAFDQKASDIHFSFGHPPLFRKGSELIASKGEALGKEDIEKMIYSVLSKEQKKQFIKDSFLVVVVSIADMFRFRLSVFNSKNGVEAVLHLISSSIPDLPELLLPDVVTRFTERKSGLVIISGIPGSGKSTTASSLINKISAQRSCVIMSFEQPIEHMYASNQAVVRQKEITNGESFSSAIKQSLRQDADVIVVSQMPDWQTAKSILDAALNGCLVFVIVCASDSGNALRRMIDLFPEGKRADIRGMIAECLQGVITQALLPQKINKDQRVPAAEILINSPKVSQAIKEGFLEKLNSIIKEDTEYGMRSIHRSAEELFEKGLISKSIVDDLLA